MIENKKEIDHGGKTAGGHKRKSKYIQYSYREPLFRYFFSNPQLLRLISTKYAKLMEIMPREKGIAFVYTQLIGDGIRIMSMILEEYGFSRYQDPTLDQHSNLPYLEDIVGEQRSKRCAICHNMENKHDGKDHPFTQGHYVIFTGKNKDNLSKKIDTVNSIKNMNGELIKVVLVTQMASEGLDFHHIRSVHIMDPWHNLTKIYQTIGRGIRHCSHVDFKNPEDRVVRVYKYVATHPTIPHPPLRYVQLTQDNLNTQIPTINVSAGEYYAISTDMTIYYRAFKKDLYIKKLEQAMKQTAVDCLTNINANMFGVNYSRECNYTLCKYECNNKLPDSMKTLDESQLHLDTYDIQFSASVIRKTEHLIHKIFRLHFVYELNDIVDEIHKQDRTIKDIFIYEALNRFVGKSGSFKPKIVVDKYGREGIIINRGITKDGKTLSYYMFQPVDLYDTSIPYSQRVLPILKKNTSVLVSSSDEIKRKRTTRQLDDKILDNIMQKFMYELTKPDVNDEMNTLIHYRLDLEQFRNIVDYIKSIVFRNMAINEYRMLDIMIYVIMNFNRIAPINQTLIFEKLVQVYGNPEFAQYKSVVYVIINILLYYLSRTRTIISNTSDVFNSRELSELHGHNILGKYRKFNTTTFTFEYYVLLSRDDITNPFLKYKTEMDRSKSSRITRDDEQIANDIFGYSMFDKKGNYRYKLFKKLTISATLSGTTIDRRKQSKGIVCVTALNPEIIGYLKQLSDLVGLNEFDTEDYVKVVLHNNRGYLCAFTEYLFMFIDMMELNKKRSYFYQPEVELVNRIITAISKRN